MYKSCKPCERRRFSLSLSLFLCDSSFPNIERGRSRALSPSPFFSLPNKLEQEGLPTKDLAVHPAFWPCMANSGGGTECRYGVSCAPKGHSKCRDCALCSCHGLEFFCGRSSCLFFSMRATCPNLAGQDEKLWEVGVKFWSHLWFLVALFFF